MALTTRQIEAAKALARPYKLADAQGLYLYVTAVGGKSWRANYSRDGKQATRTYGRWPDVSLAEARRAHGAARGAAATTRHAVPTFEVAMREWLAVKLPALSNPKHQGQVEGTLERFVLPALGRVSLDQIERTRLVEVVRAVQVGDRIETAHRVAGRITAVFDHAQDVGHIKRHDAAGLSRVLLPRKTKRPMASIDPGEAGALMRAIDSYNEPVTRAGLLLLAYTFVRVAELRGMRWDELRENGAIWVVPPLRVKGGDDTALPHVVPLSPQAQAAIGQMRLINGERELVLDSPLRPRHPVSENTFLFALYRLGYRGRMTAHGFRALASTVLNEQSGFDRDVIERQLQHKEIDAVRAAYNRAQYLDQRRALMHWWGNWLESQHTA